MDGETVSLDRTEDSTFITKLIVEMKNTFNKTEKQLIPPETESSSEAITSIDPEMSKNIDKSNLDDIILEELPTNNLSAVPAETTLQESVYDEISTEKIDETLSTEEAIKEESDGDTTPRIIIHVRKPLNNTIIKIKNGSDTLKSRRSLRNKIQETQLKRSARRRISRDGESVLQSAIARKEKSYNEATKPQRLTRQLKLTPKILENLNQNQLKEKYKNKSIKMAAKQLVDGDIIVNINENNMHLTSDEKNNRKHKLKGAVTDKYARRTIKKLKGTHLDGKDSDTDQNIQQAIKENNNGDNEKFVNRILNVNFDERRRSQRKSTSRYKEEDISNVEEIEVQEGSLAEEESMYPAHPECSSVGAELIASKLCVCTRPSQIYALDDGTETFCSAVDSVGEKLVGCNNLINSKDKQMVRMSTRVPFGIFCDVHRNRMLRHNCCPTCGVFCTQGRFVECEAKHQYHRSCEIIVGEIHCCPHCGLSTPTHDIIITMYSTKRPVFLTKQRIFNPPAKITFPIKCDYNIKRSGSPLIPFAAVEIPSESNFFDNNCDSDTIFDVIKREDYKTFANILGSKAFPMISAVTNEDNMTLIHYCVKHGHLPAVHMLLSAGIELDVLDKDQNTPLMVAVLAYKNGVVKYLVKAGANIYFKGTDGMTALHLAAECGNLESCELLVETATNKQEYVNCADDGGWTALVWACEHNHLNIVKYLLKKSADPSLRDLKQNVALHWAAFSGCQENVELLLNYGTDVNVVNAQGDTPLHIAARQGKYDSVIILLMRGASVNVLNKLTETPLECAQQYEDCYKLILLNITIQSVQQQYQRKIILSNDISNGKEINPIQCINLLDHEPKPTKFVYVTDYCVTSEVIIDNKITSLHSCICDDNCSFTECMCVGNSLTNWYDEDGKLVPHFDFADAPLIFECNQVCSCNALTCNNRVVQRGLIQRFQVFRTEKKGWGIKTLNSIIRGTFVCEYIGEIVSDIEADQREDDSYFFGLDNHEEPFSIDARKYGNFGRFLNHSCSPNLTPIKVFTSHQDLRFPRIALFANRDIIAEEELCFDYGEKFWSVKCKFFLCECRSPSCRYSKETTQEDVDNYHLSPKD